MFSTINMAEPKQKKLEKNNVGQYVCPGGDPGTAFGDTCYNPTPYYHDDKPTNQFRIEIIPDPKGDQCTYPLGHYFSAYKLGDSCKDICETLPGMTSEGGDTYPLDGYCIDNAKNSELGSCFCTKITDKKNAMYDHPGRSNRYCENDQNCETGFGCAKNKQCCPLVGGWAKNKTLTHSDGSCNSGGPGERCKHNSDCSSGDCQGASL